MTKSEIIEGNKLIAEFIGIPVREYVNIKGEHIGLMITDEDGDLDHKYGIDWFWPHVQWNDLMPVVEKICDIDNQADDVLFYKMTRAKLSIFSTSIFCTINATHERVIEFIKWYNTNK